MLMMADVDLFLKLPTTICLAIMGKNLMVIGEVDICPRPATLHHLTQVTMVDCCVYLLLLFVFIEIFMTMKEVIVLVMMEDVYLGLNITSTPPFTIV